MTSEADNIAVEPAPVATPIEAIDDKRFRIVAIIAGVLFAPQVLAHIFIPLIVLPTFSALYRDMGGPVPAPTAILLALGPWLGVILGVIDALVFWLFYRLARKYWIGLLFAPLFAGGIVAGPLIAVLYMPMFQVTSLIQ